MKKFLALALAGAMMASTATVSFASATKKVAAEDAAKPKVWVSYAESWEGDPGFTEYVYDVNYDIGTELTAVTSRSSKGQTLFTGTAIAGASCKIKVTPADYEYVYAMSADLGEDTAALNENDNTFTALFSGGLTAPKNSISAKSGKIMQIVVALPEETEFDPYTLKLDFGEVCFNVYSWNDAKTTAKETEYSNLSSADYPVYASFGTQKILTEVAELADKTFAAAPVNVEGVTAATRVKVTYVPTSETKTFGESIGTLLGIEGEGTFEGTVRFAIAAPETMDADGFAFSVINE